MKTMVVTSSSSARSLSSTMEDRSESRDSYYFPGCRKDANCSCDICLASINATLDLMPMSSQRSSLTKFSASKSMMERTPVSFNRSVLSTPRSEVHQLSRTPPLKSTGKSIPSEKRKNKPRVFGFNICRFLLVASLIFASDSVLGLLILGLFSPVLSPEIVKKVGEESCILEDWNLKLDFLEKKLRDTVHVDVSNCRSPDSLWKIDQEGLILNSRCTLYKSISEEVSLWGWPLQTAGLLTSELSSRSFTILTGRVTEWSEGRLGFSIHKANSSWVQTRWSASAVQMDSNTWILEYRSSLVLENSRFFTAAFEFLKFRMLRTVREMKQQFWLLPAFFHPYGSHSEDVVYKHPT
ncbi:uncharacterized protein LOC122641711 [Telopea speciosissima]|uniref:uncharacterized protein LOC122641711 n=1 Tax=Telopea speciosissima TaxID=54955 RepID=UPI001CC47216|nr:uncharacterized protein LOC122641711 [Telopea speciosissima]XP_043690937.1 uncharacterized protein LOC122641711 [Telopea speciosissima]